METLSTLHGTYTTRLSAKYRNRKPWQAPNPKEIYSFIPGTIVSLKVKAGQTVKEGDVLLEFNAMKMLNTYRSPVGGKVKHICVKEGQVVPKGELLLEFE